VNAYVAKSKQGKRPRGERPGVHWQVDFTEVKPGKYGYKHLLVFVDTFSGWVGAFLTKQETATVVAKKILEEIFPRFGVPKVIGLDISPAFVSKVRQGLAEILGTNWKLHCVYCLQRSGQVE
jgi:transposase InsO family protein